MYSTHFSLIYVCKECVNIVIYTRHFHIYKALGGGYSMINIQLFFKKHVISYRCEYQTILPTFKIQILNSNPILRMLVVQWQTEPNTKSIRLGSVRFSIFRKYRIEYLQDHGPAPWVIKQFYEVFQNKNIFLI